MYFVLTVGGTRTDLNSIRKHHADKAASQYRKAVCILPTI